MGAVDTVKEIADLVKKVGDRELYQKIVELQADVVSLSTKNFELEQKCRELQTELNLKKSLKHVRSLYGVEGDPIPFCPRCYESNAKLIHLFPRKMSDPKIEAWECHICNYNFHANPGEHFRPSPDRSRRVLSE